MGFFDIHAVVLELGEGERSASEDWDEVKRAFCREKFREFVA